jgi:hypothetical protein
MNTKPPSLKMLFWVLIWSSALACPTYECGSIAEGYCAVLDDNQNVIFTSNPCSDEYGCALLDTINFAWVGQSGCTIDLSTEVGSDFVSSCIDRPTGDELVTGFHPKTCVTQKDCQVVNGNFSICACGFDGESYCQPELGSSAFNFYWEDCGAHNSSVSRGEYLTMMNLMYSYYIYTINPPKCMVSNIFELHRIKQIAETLSLNATEIPLLNATNEGSSNSTDSSEEDNSWGWVLEAACVLLLI